LKPRHGFDQNRQKRTEVQGVNLTDLPTFLGGKVKRRLQRKAEHNHSSRYSEDLFGGRSIERAMNPNLWTGLILDPLQSVAVS